MNAELIILLVSFLLLVAGFLGGGYLFFRREIRAMLLARRLGPAMDQFVCGRCGLCCTFTVITDRATVSALEKTSGQSKDTFSTPFLFFWALLKKGADGACVFRARDPDQPERFACSVYEARPQACRQFPRVTFMGCIPGVDARCPQIVRQFPAPVPAPEPCSRAVGTGYKQVVNNTFHAPGARSVHPSEKYAYPA